MEPYRSNDTTPATIESNAISKEEHKRLFNRGLKFLCAGVALMGISFAINYLLFHSDQSFEIPMYIMTTVGSVCIIKSLGDILGF